MRKTKSDLKAKRLASATAANGDYQAIDATRLGVGDIVIVEAGDLVPGDGEVIEGVASVNESAITGESAPVIRESGGDRSAVTGGTMVLSDWRRSSPGSGDSTSPWFPPVPGKATPRS